MTGWIGSEPEPPESFQGLGQVIFKHHQWACAYGIKRFVGDIAFQPFRLWFQGVGDTNRFRFCHYQVLKFERFDDAVSYMNSKGIAYAGRLCGEF